jgi:hypothetical protein
VSSYQALLGEQLQPVMEQLDTTPTDGSVGFTLRYTNQ